ncbi:MAG: hypothetical protein H7326_05625 [Bdellovibrionaceae bacterium]|nr:hypothetical protein [Pseudobdellovibrionaceae bacterium]
MIELLKNAVTNLKGFEIKVGIEIEHGCVYTIATGDADFILPPTDMGHEVSLVSWAIQ